MRERKGERWRGREGGGVRKEKGREEKEESERMGGNGKGGRETGMQEDGGRERERVRNKERERGGHLRFVNMKTGAAWFWKIKQQSAESIMTAVFSIRVCVLRACVAGVCEHAATHAPI